MRAIQDAHVAEPGLAVVDVAAADEATALALHAALAARWATALADRPTWVLGECGVRLRCYLDLRQEETSPDVVGPAAGPPIA